ncbi:MAG: heavy metal translocating P-type ATPase metal-binding domain-containing protein [Candidatus Pseudobacter hemicellulosilyticus]|uniref:Heavy metal translocating P-type ATPase metal-binding domain-containing protein n=1 Tax=Candidatus Pseudobacter hemicellulosilyticus TaxID=3121375 RepID=A0AAJ5WSW3_9BACT|nr:MAG: heavy metal translocating P-type ATPase metal-binding domain-containing protein [Pseudobacter sp.]
MGVVKSREQLTCYHCGEQCQTSSIQAAEKQFCCEGCRMVYQLLNQNGLCDYYSLNDKPGINQRQTTRKDKFNFLEDTTIQQKLIHFSSEERMHVTFYLPAIHCSSCLYLLENLHKIDPGILSARVNFTRKEVDIAFDHRKISLRRVAELLTSIGYEPYISLNDLQQYKPRPKKTMVYQLGIAGFCFANIMLLSFPEYLGLEGQELQLQGAFRILNFILALPVFFYCALPFFNSGWKGLRAGYLNIDAPIALAVLVTYARSVYEVVSGTGAGYFDSMSGIVFFMLAGRVLQDKTYEQLSFDRDFTAYFPIAVSVVKDRLKVPTPLPELKTGDTLLIHNDELIPCDGILTRGKAFIDYSFVTGESMPVRKEMGEIVYAGGRQTGGNIEVLVVREVSQSYLTRLWSKDELKGKKDSVRHPFTDLISRYFTYIVLTIAFLGALYWWDADASKVWNVVTAVLIVACPCALLLSTTFTNGNILRILGRNGFYLRNAQTIENIAGVDHIIFDKTGTLTTTSQQEIEYNGVPLSALQQHAAAAISAQSNHPLSKAVAQFFNYTGQAEVTDFRELTGQGVQGYAFGQQVSLGSRQFVSGKEGQDTGTRVFVAFGGKLFGYFSIRNQYRQAAPPLVRVLSQRYGLSVASGDNASSRPQLEALFNKNATLLFEQKPADKLHYVQELQEQGQTVMMIGDGLNDAGALQQSDVGIAIAEDSNNFTPASDAILEASQLSNLPKFIRLCKVNKRIVLTSFVVSILYNLVGLFFAVQGMLSPLVAAILMPASSLSILLITFGSSNLVARWWKL